MLPDINANDGYMCWSPKMFVIYETSKEPYENKRDAQSNGSWLAVVTTSSLFVVVLYPSQPHPEPWIAAVVVFRLVLKATKTACSVNEYSCGNSYLLRSQSHSR